MRALAIFGLMAVIAAPAAAQAQFSAEPTALTPALEQCIRTNAVKVEASVPDLDKAVEYLVAEVCAVSTADQLAQQAKAASDAQAAQMKAVCDKRKASAKSSDDEDDGCDSIDFAGGSVLYASGFSSLMTAPPAAKALAASLLLDLRISHLKTGSSH